MPKLTHIHNNYMRRCVQNQQQQHIWPNTPKTLFSKLVSLLNRRSERRTRSYCFPMLDFPRLPLPERWFWFRPVCLHFNITCVSATQKKRRRIIDVRWSSGVAPQPSSCAMHGWIKAQTRTHLFECACFLCMNQKEEDKKNTATIRIKQQRAQHISHAKLVRCM